MWTYEQSTGVLKLGDKLVSVGYSGFGDGRNNPDKQSVPNIGPIPTGFYHIGEPECVDTPGPHGPYVLRLSPEPGTVLLGRDGFLIHGDNQTHTASHGCIILARVVRERIAKSGDRHLQVIRGIITHG